MRTDPVIKFLCVIISEESELQDKNKCSILVNLLNDSRFWTLLTLSSIFF